MPTVPCGGGGGNMEPEIPCGRGGGSIEPCGGGGVAWNCQLVVE